MGGSPPGNAQRAGEQWREKSLQAIFKVSVRLFSDVKGTEGPWKALHRGDDMIGRVLCSDYSGLSPKDGVKLGGGGKCEWRAGGSQNPRGQ